MWRIVRSPALILGLAVSAVALFLAFRGIHWGEVGNAMGEVNYGLLLLAMALMLVSLYVRALRWSSLFYPKQGLRIGNVFGVMNAGYAINNVLPLRIGEFARAYLISETEDVTAPRAFSTILVERLLDTITVVAMLMITLPFIDAPDWAKGPALLVGLGFLSLAVLLTVLSAARSRATALIAWIVKFLPHRYQERAHGSIDAAFEGLAVLRQPSALAQATAWSAISWLTSAVFTFVVLRAFNIDLPFTAGLFITSAVALGMIIPASPGYIGVFHAIAIESLVSVFDVDKSQAASYALVQHAMAYLTPIVLGGIYLWRERHILNLARLPGIARADGDQELVT